MQNTFSVFITAKTGYTGHRAPAGLRSRCHTGGKVGLTPHRIMRSSTYRCVALGR